MKKKWLGDSIDPGLLQKMSKVMRLVFILIFGFTMAVSAESYSQGTRMDINLKNATIRGVMDYVENNSKFILWFIDIQHRKTHNLLLLYDNCFTLVLLNIQILFLVLQSLLAD